MGWRRLEVWASLAALGMCALRLAPGLGPDASYNSDSAVPILVMQGLARGPFALYYPGQDRYGMWPFLAGHALGLTSPEAAHLWALLGLCSMVLPMRAVLGGTPHAVLAVLLPVALNDTVTVIFFDSGQPYLWQSVALAWAWWACRGALSAGSGKARPWCTAGFLLAGSLATWTSTISLVALLAMMVLEAARVRPRPVRLLPPAAALVLTSVADVQLRRVYGGYCERMFGTRLVTALRVDRGFLLSNLGRVLAVAWHTGVLLPSALALAIAATPRSSRTERVNLLVMVAVALCSLPAYALIYHFRENGFADRYFALPAFWAGAALTSGALALLTGLAGPFGSALRLAGLGVLVWVTPRSPPDPLAGPRAESARFLGPEPRVLLGDYWQVYVSASLTPFGQVVPIPAEGEYDRFPALRREWLVPGRTVLAPCALERPDGTLQQYGAFLHRTPGTPIGGNGGPWCFHAVDRAAPSP